MIPPVRLSLLFSLTLPLVLNVRQVVSSPADESLARLLPLNPGPVEDQTVMEERISGLLALFKMTSPDTTTAVVFGRHSRYLFRNNHPDLLYSLLLSLTSGIH